MRQITDSTFASEVAAETMIVVDMYADWCPPCKALSPVLEAVVADLQAKGKKVEVVKHNIDTDPVKPREFGVRSIPTLLFFKGGTLRDTIVGAKSGDIIANKILEIDSATATTTV